MAPVTQSRIVTIHRGPRRWPHLSTETVTIPTVNAPGGPSPYTIVVSITSLIGLVLSAFAYTLFSKGSGGLIIGFLAISGLTMVGSFITYLMQSSAARKDARTLAERYDTRLRQIRERLTSLLNYEHQERHLNDLAVPGLLDQLHSPGAVWQRRPGDPDFLAARIGLGEATPHFSVKLNESDSTVSLPPKDAIFEGLQKKGRELAADFQMLHQVPVTLALAEHPAVALVSNNPDTSSATSTAKAIVAQVAFHHSPREAHVIILAPVRHFDEWNWAATLPYTSSTLQSLGISPADRERTLSLLLAELVRRENELGDTHYGRERHLFLPHLVIVIDAFVESDPGIENGSLLATPAISLALRRGAELGATVVSVCATRAQAPGQATLLVETQFNSATVSELHADPPAPRACTQRDVYPVNDYNRLSQALRFYRPEAESYLTMPSQVPLLPLLTPPIADPGLYNIRQQWLSAGTTPPPRATRPGGKAGFAIPIGETLGEEPLYLDFVNDGPHGLLIGQTGSGKSELLRSMVAALAIQYSPEQANFVLVDYKAGLALEHFASLPHTVAYLTNMSQAGQTNRFLKMLEAEILHRQEAKKAGKQPPRLFVIIDEFAEMVNRKAPSDNADTIIDNLLSIVRLGRELNVHLLFAAQRPEGSVIQRLRGYVQYRICLRTNSPDDSREVLGRPDAAELPAGIPGRGYLLRGDNELQLFQAVRVAHPYAKDPQATGGKARRTVDEVIADRMQETRNSFAIKTWPTALPTPSFENPTPLVIFPSPTAAAGTRSWDLARTASLQPMAIPLGIFDRPAEQKQNWVAADFVGYTGRLSGGPLLVLGDFNAGKTTTLQSLLLYAAATSKPSEVRWYVLQPNGSLADFAPMPHLTDWLERGTSNLSVVSDDAEFLAFKARFERALAAENRPRLWLVIDDYDELRKRLAIQNQKALDELVLLAMKSRERQAYVAVSAARPAPVDGLPPALLSFFATKVVLYMADRDQLRSVLGGRVAYAPDPIGGRGFIQTRKTLDEVQVAAPVDGADEEARVTHLHELIAKLAQ